MDPKLRGTRTLMNLATAFAGESQARNKYTFFASKAKKEGYEQIAAIFLETAEQEKEHAKIWYKLLFGPIGNTMHNLEIAASGENEEWTDMYPMMAQDAREEGFNEIAELFTLVGGAEKAHDERFRKLLDNVKMNSVFSRAKETIWQCRNCGHLHVGLEAPEECPLCAHPRAHFQVKAENY